MKLGHEQRERSWHPALPTLASTPSAMQDLHPDTVHVGLPPGRKFSLSHGWSTEMHPDPSGSKMARLAAKLVELDADDELDGVFVDYCSCVHVDNRTCCRQVCCISWSRSPLAWQCLRRRSRRSRTSTSRQRMRRSPCRTARQRNGSSSTSPCGKVRVSAARTRWQALVAPWREYITKDYSWCFCVSDEALRLLRVRGHRGSHRWIG